MILFVGYIVSGAEDDMVVTVVLIRMGRNDIGIPSSKEPFGKLLSYLMCLFFNDLS